MIDQRAAEKKKQKRNKRRSYKRRKKKTERDENMRKNTNQKKNKIDEERKKKFVCGRMKVEHPKFKVEMEQNKMINFKKYIIIKKIAGIEYKADSRELDR